MRHSITDTNIMVKLHSLLNSFGFVFLVIANILGTASHRKANWLEEARDAGAAPRQVVCIEFKMVMTTRSSSLFHVGLT